MTSDELPANERVLIITSITRVMNSPQVVEGETSSTGKTISAPASKHSDSTVRLDTETILSGESEYRDSRSYELYTPARLRAQQRSNHAPGPQAGANQISDASELPEPTHWPRLDEPADAPAVCPNCGSEDAPFRGEHRVAPQCEACGHVLEEDDENDDEPENGPESAGDVGGADGATDPLDMSTWERGDVFAVDLHGELLLTKIKGRMATTGAEAVDRAGNRWTVRASDMMGLPQLILEDLEESSACVMVDEEDSFTRSELEYAGKNTDWLQRWVRENYHGGGGGGDNDSSDDSGGDGGGETPDDTGGGAPEIRTDGGGQTALSDFGR